MYWFVNGQRVTDPGTIVLRPHAVIVAYEDALRAGRGAFQAVLFAWDIVMPALWELSKELSDMVGGDPPSGYEAEMLQFAAMHRLWAKVRPRLAMQRRIP